MGAPGKLDVAGRSGQVGEEMQPAGRQFNGHPIAEDLAQRLGERAASCGIEAAHALDAMLRGRGLDVRIDFRNLDLHLDIVNQLEAAIRRCSVFLAFHPPRKKQNSPWMTAELLMANDHVRPIVQLPAGLMGLNRIAPPTLAGWIIALLWILFVVQIFLSIRRVYRQGWFMSTLKFFVGGFVYMIVLFLALAATFFITLALPAS